MWKNHKYHSWFPYVLWLNAAITFGFAAYVTRHYYPLLTTIFDGATYIFVSHVSLLFLSLFEIALGFYLVKMFKNNAVLSGRILVIVILLLFINAITVPFSDITITATMKKQSPQSIMQQDADILDAITAAFPKYTEWQSPTPRTVTYNDFSKGTLAKLQEITGLEKTGTATVSSILDATLGNQQYFTQYGWTIDNNQAADGPTGSVWGYKREIGGKTQILQLSFTNNSIAPVANRPLSITCPCNFTYKIFLSNPF